MKHILPAVSLSFLGAFSFGCGDAQSVEDDEKRNSSSGGASSDDASGGAPSLPETTGGAASGGQETGAGGTTIAEPDPCEAREGSLVAELVSLTVSNAAGGEPRKGEGLVFEITLRNVGEGVGDISVMPRLKSHRFSDYDDVPAGTASGTLCEGESVFTLEVGPFLDDEERGKHYALGSGDYTVTGLELSGQQERVPSDVDFNIATSGALLVPVIYAANYFDGVNGLSTDGVGDYLAQAFTRPAQIFTPDSMNDPDGPGRFEEFPGGFDEMMGVEHHFRLFSGFPGESTTSDGWCEDATYFGQESLGLAQAWTTQQQVTRPERHGFDYLLALHPGLGGGVACSWIDVQVSGRIGSDVHRQQIVAVHETAHVFGAPHCDDLGNGSGQNLQNYVMCSGEKHANYPEKFVFHSESRRKMSSRWN